MSDAVQEAQTAYARALREVGPAVAREWLEQEIDRRRLYYGGRPICSTLTPLFFSGETYRAAMRAAGLVAGALDIAARKALRHKDLRERLAFPSWMEPFVAGDGDSPATVLVFRLDGFMGDNGVVRFLEANPIPGGMTKSDALVEVFREGPVWKHASLDKLDVRRESASQAGFRAFEELYVPAGAKNACLGLVGSLEGLRSKPHGVEDESLLAALSARGHEVVWGDASNISVGADGVLFSGRRVDVVQIYDLTALGKDYDQHPLMAALAFKYVASMGGLALPLLIANKGIFALLTDTDFVDALPRDMAAAVRTHVPWTRLVADASATDSEGKPVALLEHVRARRANLVLKPSDGFGGSGVILGWEKTESEWEACIQQALRTPHVVQERVDTQSAEFTTVDAEGELRSDQYSIDFNPFVWCGSRPAGVWNRMSRAGLMNVTSGNGSEFALFPLG